MLVKDVRRNWRKGIGWVRRQEKGRGGCGENEEKTGSEAASVNTE